AFDGRLDGEKARHVAQPGLRHGLDVARGGGHAAERHRAEPAEQQGTPRQPDQFDNANGATSDSRLAARNRTAAMIVMKSSIEARGLSRGASVGTGPEP